MATSTSYEDSPTATKPVPTPLNPVAQQPVDVEAVELDWTPVPEVERYRVQIAATDDFETIYYDEVTERQAQLSLEEVLPTGATTGCWRVRAETEEWVSPWSDPAHFSTAPADGDPQNSLMVDAPPVPLHPTEESSVNRNATTFAWEPIPEAAGYQLQVAPSASFSAPAVDLTLDQTTSLTLYKTLPQADSPLYWRVRSLFPQATPGPWSESIAFELSPAPAPETEPTPEPEVTESSEPEAAPVAAGPAQRSRTSRAMSLTVALLAVVSFLVTILLVALLG